MGFDGHYLFNDHTRAHVRELWQSRLVGAGTYGAWQASGAPSTTQQARAAVDDLLAAPATEFPADLGRELDRIISSAEAG
jgi:trimethylamine:corrinoid methyltransferase-like protein